MKRSMKKGFVLALGAVALLTRTAFATPSTHIWAPSTDVQAYGVFHLTHDTYIPGDKDLPVISNEGLTVGVLPSEKVNAEVGFDFINSIGAANLYPLQLNFKVGTPENALGDQIPAIAVGAYGLGTEKDVTDYNIYYAKIGKTVGTAGRFSIGYYQGNDKLLLDENGDEANSGVLLCWERTISEISDNLWVAVDYQGGDSAFGTLNFGFSWKFAPNTSVIFAYDKLNNSKLTDVNLADDTYTVQLDIDFDVFSGKK